MASEQPTTASEAPIETKVDASPVSGEAAEEPTSTTTDAQPADAPTPDAAGEATTTEATGPDGESAEAQPTSADGTAVATPASAKGKRKSGAGVPEHKNKKLNKRKSTVNLTLGAQPGDYFFAKFKGYAPWPSVICDEDMLPETLLATRPVSTENSQGELRADYQEGGKNAKDRTYPIMFLETNEFAWIPNTALTPINPGDTAEDKLKPKMSNSLKAAYALAEERHPITFYKDILNEYTKAEKLRREEIAQKEAERLEKNAKKAERAEKAAENKDKKDKKEKRKSTSKSKDAVSEEDDADEKETETKPKNNKRKKDLESDGEGAKPKKTPKTIKIKAKETPNGTNGESAKKTEKKKKVVSKPSQEKEEEKEVLTDEQKLERREKAVLYLRHRLQKGFLARDQAPKEEEMEAMADFFNQLESFTDLEPQVIRNTKINKVLKGIVKLASIPKEEEYNFKTRSNDLLNTWSSYLDQGKAETPTTTAPAETPATESEAKLNGDAAEKEEDAVKETAESAEPGNDDKEEAADVTMTDAKDDEPAEAAGETAEQD